MGTDPSNPPTLDCSGAYAFDISPGAGGFNMSFANLKIFNCSDSTCALSFFPFVKERKSLPFAATACLQLQSSDSVGWTLVISNVEIVDGEGTYGLYTDATETTITNSTFKNCGQISAVQIYPLELGMIVLFFFFELILEKHHPYLPYSFEGIAATINNCQFLENSQPCKLVVSSMVRWLTSISDVLYILEVQSALIENSLFQDNSVNQGGTCTTKPSRQRYLNLYLTITFNI